MTPSPIGTVFSDLTVVGVARIGPKGAVELLCRCACGKEAVKRQMNLENGHSTTCGGHKSAKAVMLSSQRAAVYPKETNTRSRLFKIFDGMRGRCADPKNASYRYYGELGVSVCAEWAEYGAFHDWATTSGYAPGLTLDRIDNLKGYSPGNCRWATRKEQQRNRKIPALQATAFGETKYLADWGADPRCAVSYLTFRQRLTMGWPAERALTSPLRATA